MFFQFEADFVQSLRCIPMQVRYKLDTCGVKLKLEHWHRFSQEERRSLTQLACEPGEAAAAYRDTVQDLVVKYTGAPAKDLPVDANPPWMDGEIIPQQVKDKAQDCAVTVGQEQWRQLTPIQRFALIKLSRPSHENRNFVPALQEFVSATVLSD
ncbi:MAG: nitrate reductase associated protein [Elainellaceae cyanobacterium]